VGKRWVRVATPEGGQEAGSAGKRWVRVATPGGGQVSLLYHSHAFSSHCGKRHKFRKKKAGDNCRRIFAEIDSSER